MVVISLLKYADKSIGSKDVEPRAYMDELFYDVKFLKGDAD